MVFMSRSWVSNAAAIISQTPAALITAMCQKLRRCTATRARGTREAWQSGWRAYVARTSSTQGPEKPGARDIYKDFLWLPERADPKHRVHRPPAGLNPPSGVLLLKVRQWAARPLPAHRPTNWRITPRNRQSWPAKCRTTRLKQANT